MGEHEENKSNEQLVKELISSFSTLREKMEDPDYVQFKESFKAMEKELEHVKNDINTLKNRLLDPDDGLITDVHANSQHRRMEQARSEEYEQLIRDHNELLRWKRNFIRFFWLFVTTLSGVATYIISEIVNRSGL
jgi:superfamily I DNA and RNA helicase